MDTSKRLFVAVCANLDFLRISKKFEKSLSNSMFSTSREVVPGIEPQGFGQMPAPSAIFDASR